MSFRKRNTVLSAGQASRGPTASAPSESPEVKQHQLTPGLRPSALDGRLTTSTGTASLDALLAGHAGLALGSSLLVEEQGTTDFSGVLLRYYAAEGLVQGHDVHMLGFSEAWKYGLPGLAATSQSGSSSAGKSGSVPSSSSAASGAQEERMKIAWRYEALGNNRSQALPSRDQERGSTTSTFCHSFDLGKRLASTSMKGQFHAIPCLSGSLSFSVNSSASSPLRQFVKHLQAKLASSSPSTIHRVVVPSLLSPTLYSSSSCDPAEILQFLHSLRALLRLYSKQLTALLTLPVSLHPRKNGLTRWMEILSDGVIELVPLPSSLGATSSSPGASDNSKDSKEAEKMQGIVKVYTLPVYHEKGGGGAEGNHFRENLSFSLSSSRGLVITPYSLPPLLEDDDRKEKSPATTVKDGLDF